MDIKMIEVRKIDIPSDWVLIFFQFEKQFLKYIEEKFGNENIIYCVKKDFIFVDNKNKNAYMYINGERFDNDNNN